MTVPSQDQIGALNKMSKPLSLAEVVSTASFAVITDILRRVSSDFKDGSYSNMRNIKPVDCDQIAELLDAVAGRIEQMLAVISVQKEEAK